MKREEPIKEKETEMSSGTIFLGSNSASFGYPIWNRELACFQDLMAAANALDENDPLKTKEES